MTQLIDPCAAPCSEKNAEAWIQTIHQHRLFDRDVDGYWVQHFAVGWACNHAALDAARSFAEALRERFGDQLEVIQEQARVRFALAHEDDPPLF